MNIEKLAVILKEHGLYIEINDNSIDLTDNKGFVYNTLTLITNKIFSKNDDAVMSVKCFLGY